MSRLWSSLIAQLGSLPPGIIGLGFGKNSVSAVRATRDKGGYCITHAAEEVLPFSLFTDAAPREEDRLILSQAMQRLAASIPQTYWPLQISLPDPAAIVQIMEFDALPSAARERDAIALFRLEKEFPAMAPMQCTTQVISQAGEQGLLLTLFIQRAWLDCLNDACRSAGFVPSVTDIAASHFFNRFYDVIRGRVDDGVLIAIERDFWSIVFWDDSHRPRFVRSRWRDSSMGADEEYESIAQDVERLIMSYVLRVPGRKIENLYLCGGEDDRESLLAKLGVRMHLPCVQLDATDNISMAPGLAVQNIPPSVLAATLLRI